MGKKEGEIDEQKEVDRDSNIISHDEFGKLEKKENKGLKSLFAKKKKKEEEKPKEDDGSADAADANIVALLKMIKLQKGVIEKLGISIGRLEGKFELEQDTEHAINDRISDLSSRIGELNSMVLTRERKMDKIEMEFENLKDEIHDVRPERIRKMFEQKDESILINQAGIEKMKVIVDGMSKEIRDYRVIMNRVKSFENLLKTLEEIGQKMKEIDNTKNYADRMTSKVEMLFSELKKKLVYLDTHEDKIKYLEEVTQHIVKTVDSFNMKVDKDVNKEDFKKTVEKLKGQIEIIKGEVKKVHNVAEKGTIELKSQIKKNHDLVDSLSKEARGTRSILDKLDYVKLTKKVVEFDKKFNAGSNISQVGKVPVVESSSVVSDIYSSEDNILARNDNLSKRIAYPSRFKTAVRRISLNKPVEKGKELLKTMKEAALHNDAPRFYHMISEAYSLLRNNDLVDARQKYIEATELFVSLSSKEKKVAHKKMLLLHQSLSNRIAQR